MMTETSQKRVLFDAPATPVQTPIQTHLVSLDNLPLIEKEDTYQSGDRSGKSSGLRSFSLSTAITSSGRKGDLHKSDTSSDGSPPNSSFSCVDNDESKITVRG